MKSMQSMTSMTERSFIQRKEYATMTTYEVTFDEDGDLGISLKVDAYGRVVVSKLKSIQGYAELLCPELQPNDVLVKVDDQCVVSIPFEELMQKLHETTMTRPTRLEFLSVERYDSLVTAVKEWTAAQHPDAAINLVEGEFNVMFEPNQPTGLLFTEGYIMITLLKLAYIEPMMATTLELADPHSQETQTLSLVDSCLVRINTNSVLGAPVEDVLALLYDATSFPKQLWLAHPTELQRDYDVLTISSSDQLKWLCFVPMERMMQVPVVSYAAVAVKSNDRRLGTRLQRRDGIRSKQYLMSINGFSTLRMSAASFSEEKSHMNSKRRNDLIDVVTKSLEQLRDRPRILRFRDLDAYRREFHGQQPLSPWQRDRHNVSERPTKKITQEEGQTHRVLLDRQPRNFFRLLIEASEREEGVEPISTFEQVEHCEGRRQVASFDTDISTRHNRTHILVIPDNAKPIGLQLETEVMTKYPVFRSFHHRKSIAAMKRSKCGTCITPGDYVVSVNGVGVEHIPTDKLVEILQGECLAPCKNNETDQSSHRTICFARERTGVNSILTTSLITSLSKHVPFWRSTHS